MSGGFSGPNGTVVSQAIGRWHELLRGPLGAPSGRALEEALRASHLVFGDRPICRVLRPFFLVPEEAARLRSDVELLMRAFRKLRLALGEDATLRRVLGLSAEEEAILAADRQRIEPDAIARIDGFLVRDGAFKVIEYNAESPGGIAFGDTLAAFFRELPVFREFAKEFELASYDGLANTLRELRHAHEARVGPDAPPPTIAVVDWKSAPTRREFEICAEYFERHGCRSRVIEPSELRFESGRLVADDFVIDVVYKRVLVMDLLEHGGASHPLVRAVAAGAVACASGFGVHLLYRKELFALLWDERIEARLSDPEKEVVSRLVPWSRLVQDIEIRWGDDTRRLVDVIRQRREHLVLKPTADYGGSGVALGWLTTPDAWEEKIEQALSEPYLVQERVQLGREEFPVWRNGEIAFEPFYADVNPFVWGGTRSEGFGGRLATGELLNVTAGGGSAVPVFVVRPR